MQQEGDVCFNVGAAFYRPASQTVRDLGVLAAAVYRAETGKLRVLDAMAGCGVRSLRYLAESGADWAWVNEGNPELAELLQQNLAEEIAADRCWVSHLNANKLLCDRYLQEDFYDLVDIDSFGSPMTYATAVLWATKIGGLIYLTSTDGRTIAGLLPENSLRVYGAYARHHPAVHEQGLRLIIAGIQQQAARQGLGVRPVFSYFTGETYRVMVKLVATVQLSDRNFGMLGYCHRCGNYQLVSWRHLGRSCCPGDSAPLAISGPMWLGVLHDRATLSQMHELARIWQWERHLALLETMTAEAELPPYFFTLKEIGRRGRLDLPKRDRLIAALQESGWRASATHIDSQAIKTDASLDICVAIARAIGSG